MPQVGAALVTGLTAAFGGGAFAAALASTVVALGTIALNLAIASLLGKILAPKGTDSRDVRGLQQVIKNSIAPRRIIYGETICGGALTSIETTTVNNEELNQIITLCGHPIEDILGVFLDDEYIDISGLADTPFSTNNAANDLTTSWLVDSGAFGPDSEGVRHIAIVKNTGWGYADFTYVTDENLPEVLGDQARNLEIESKGEATRNFWNAPTSVVRDSQTGLYAATGGQQKLTNCAFIYLRFSYNEEIFNKFPQPRFHVKGKRLYNPNLDSALTAYGAAGGSHDLNDPDTWEWSED